jgi:hypothetical protein
MMLAAEGDVFADWWLYEVGFNELTCHWDGAESANGLLKPLAQVLAENTPGQGWNRGGRTFGHGLRLFVYIRDLGYTPMRDSDDEPWEGVLTEFIETIAFPTGVIHTDSAEACIAYPRARSREIDLVAMNFEELGLTDLRDAWRIYMEPESTGGPNDWDSVGANIESDQPVHWYTGNTSSQDPVTGVRNYYKWYDCFRRDYRHLLIDGGLAAVVANPSLSGQAGHREHFLDYVYPDEYLP